MILKEEYNNAIAGKWGLYDKGEAGTLERKGEGRGVPFAPLSPTAAESETSLAPPLCSTLTLLAYFWDALVSRQLTQPIAALYSPSHTRVCCFVLHHRTPSLPHFPSPPPTSPSPPFPRRPRPRPPPVPYQPTATRRCAPRRSWLLQPGKTDSCLTGSVSAQGTLSDITRRGVLGSGIRCVPPSPSPPLSGFLSLCARPGP